MIARNNTWFNLQGSVVNIEQQNFIRYFYFDHNTLVNVVKGFTALTAHLESIVTNNIFYNVDPHSITLVEQAAAEDGVPRSVIMADTLLSNEPGSVLDHVMAENERKYTVSNNCYYFSQGVQDYWTAHAADVVPLDWMNTVTQAMFDDDAGYPNFIAENNVNVDPGFTNFGGTDGMVANMNKHRAGNGFGFWGWDPDSVDYAAPLHWAVLQWPLPEDFSHSANIIGNDGFHIGSLEYYPNELVTYEGTLSINEPGVTSIPNKFSLRQNYPNPFNPVTAIDYELNVMDNVKLVIYNMLGQEVKTLVNRSNISAGSYSVNWDGIDNMGQKVSDGVYLYKLQVGENLITKKMVLLK